MGDLLGDHLLITSSAASSYTMSNVMRVPGLGAACTAGCAVRTGWNTHLIPVLQAVVRADAPAIDAYFAAAQDAVDMALGHPFKPSYQVVVDALAGFFGAHFAPNYVFFT